MLFNSVEFLVFITIVLSVYYVLKREAQNRFLLLASYTFYGWWDWRFLVLIMASTCVDFFIALAVNKNTSEYKKFLVVLSVVFNLGLLAIFKYFNFFVDSFIALGAGLGLDFDTPVWRLLPPVGISFYTFQTLAYTVDVYRRHIEPERDFFTFALFVSFFPQLVAGPIERASRLLPQLNMSRRVDVNDVGVGCTLILIGLFKKVVIADNAGIRVDAIFSNPSGFGTVSLWCGALLFTLQIYCDFSGYSNIARGVSRLLGIHLVENFKTPFFSKNIAEFWRRWHISLSEWLRDYLYIPLGGNRRGRFNTYRNLMLTMLIGGLWHGASWTFVIWGALHGFYLIAHRFWLMTKNGLLSSQRTSGLLDSILSLSSIFLTFLCVCLAFVFFRADTFSDALQYIYGMLWWQGSVAGVDIIRSAALMAFLLPLEIIQYRSRGRIEAIHVYSIFIRAPLYLMMIVALMLTSDNNVPFIYFQF